MSNINSIPAAVLLLLILLAAGSACSGRKERLVQEAVATRVADFRKKEQQKCRETLVAEAGKIVDSLLLQEALSEVNDSLSRLRPFKPLPPGRIAPLDSFPVRPIFE